MSIKKVEAYIFDGEIYLSEDKAEKAKERKLVMDKLENCFEDNYMYGEYKFSNIEEITDSLSKCGLIIKEKK